MDLKKELFDRFHLPVVLENDATAAAIGESWLGAARDLSDSIQITLGTGVGGGVVLNNEPFRGVDGTAGEIGHICVEPDGHPCGCGSNGCIEQYASATALVRMAREAGLDVAKSFEVYNLAMDGNEQAIAVFRKMGRYLGITIAGLLNLLNPEIVVLGGGAAAGWDAFIEPVTAEIEYRAFAAPAARAKIVRSELGDNAGILGVARSAFLSMT
jgi:glucokinase